MWGKVGSIGGDGEPKGVSTGQPSVGNGPRVVGVMVQVVTSCNGCSERES